MPGLAQANPISHHKGPEYIYMSLRRAQTGSAAGRAVLFVLGGMLLPFLSARVADAGFPMNYLSQD